MKIVKESTAKPEKNTTPKDKTIGIDPVIWFYEIEYGDKTEEWKEAEILVILAVSKKTLVNWSTLSLIHSIMSYLKWSTRCVI